MAKNESKPSSTKMKKAITDLPTPEEVTRITETLDLASKLDSAALLN